MSRSRPLGPRAAALPRVLPVAGAVAGLLLVLAAGCSLAPPAVLPQPARALPDAFEQADTAAAYEPAAWWRTYRDPVLNELIALALSGNLRLAEAVARVEAVQAQYRITRAGFLPNAEASADVQRQSQPANTGFGAVFGGGGGQGGDGGDDGDGGDGDGDGEVPGGAGAPSQFSFTTYSASLGFSYEADFWGRVRNETEAVLDEFAASVADLQTAVLGVLTETMESYFAVVELEQQVELTAEQVSLLDERAALTTERYARGLVSSFEVYTLRQQYRTALARLPTLRAQLYEAESRLAVLVGRYPEDVNALLDRADTLAVGLALDPVPAGLPSTLLLERPDVRAAFRRLDAARHRIGARRAERLPTITLTGTLGLQSAELTDLLSLDQRFATFVAGLTAPLFAGGRLEAQVDAAEAEYEAQAAAYARTVLTAFSEVESALDRHAEERDRLALLRTSLDDARASVDLQLDRFRRGVGDYLAYLDARSNFADARTAVVSAERSVASARLGVHRALGGAWVALEDDALRAAFEESPYDVDQLPDDPDAARRR